MPPAARVCRASWSTAHGGWSTTRRRKAGSDEVKPEEAKAALIEKAVEHARGRLSPEHVARLDVFVRLYYGAVAADDLLERSASDLYGAALAHLNLAAKRAPGTAKVHVYTPQLEEHGWQSTHTVIEIVNDDMPFLVDSVSMELNRLGSGVHLIIHPVMRVRRDGDGQLLEVLPHDAHAADCGLESFIHAEIVRETDPDQLAKLKAGIGRVLGDVRAAVDDWKPMVARAETAVRVETITVHRRAAGTIAVVGNPNAGKSSVFNRLTGLHLARQHRGEPDRSGEAVLLVTGDEQAEDEHADDHRRQAGHEVDGKLNRRAKPGRGELLEEQGDAHADRERDRRGDADQHCRPDDQRRDPPAWAEGNGQIARQEGPGELARAALGDGQDDQGQHPNSEHGRDRRDRLGEAVHDPPPPDSRVSPQARRLDGGHQRAFAP